MLHRSYSMRQPFQFIALPVLLACAIASSAARQSDPSPSSDTAQEPAANQQAASDDDEADTPPSTDETGAVAPGSSPPPAPGGGAFRFQLVAEILLPGPLADSGPRWDDDRILIETSGQLATVEDWSAATEPELTPLEPGDGEDSGNETEDDDPCGAGAGSSSEVAEPTWSYSSTGKYRGGAYPGLVVAEKRCPRCKKGWNRMWKLRVPGTRIAPPVVTETRVYFAAQDDVVYAVKRRNGYRVWSTPINYRSTRPMVRWEGSPLDTAGRAPETAPETVSKAESETVSEPVPDAEPAIESEVETDTGTEPVISADDDEAPPPMTREILLLLTDIGDRMIALDAEDGSRLTEFTIEEGSGRLTGVPLVAEDGRVVVARQDYNESTAALLVLAIGMSPRPAAPSAASTVSTAGDDAAGSEGTDAAIEPSPETPAAGERTGKKRVD